MNFIRSGFRTIRQNPALFFAEIAWRWAFGAFAWIVILFTLRMIMEGIDISPAEAAVVRSDNAYLIADATVRLLVQVLPRFLGAMILIVPLLAIAWVVAATIGRAVTLGSFFERQTTGVIPTEAGRTAGDGRPQRIYGFRVLRLNILRAVFSLATFLAFFGTVFLVSSQIGPGTASSATPAYLLAWLFLAVLVACLWGIVNWFLALAAIFIVRDGLGAWKAIAASVALYRDHKQDHLSIASWFGFMRGAALLVAVVAGLSAAATSLRAGLVISIVVALVYFAVADWLYIVRMAAYVGLARSGFQPEVPQSQIISAPQTSTLPETETATEPHSELS